MLSEDVGTKRLSSGTNVQKVLAAGDVYGKRQDEIFILDSSLKVSTSLVGNEIAIKGETSSIVKDSGSQFLSGRNVRGLKVSPKFSFSVQQGMSYRITRGTNSEESSRSKLFGKSEHADNPNLISLFSLIRHILDLIVGYVLLYFVYKVVYLGYICGLDVDITGLFPESFRPRLPLPLRVKIKGSSLVQMYTHEMLLSLLVVLLLSAVGLVRLLTGLSTLGNPLLYFVQELALQIINPLYAVFYPQEYSTESIRVEPKDLQQSDQILSDRRTGASGALSLGNRPSFSSPLSSRNTGGLGGAPSPGSRMVPRVISHGSPSHHVSTLFQSPAVSRGDNLCGYSFVAGASPLSPVGFALSCGEGLGPPAHSPLLAWERQRSFDDFCRSRRARPDESALLDSSDLRRASPLQAASPGIFDVTMRGHPSPGAGGAGAFPSMYSQSPAPSTPTVGSFPPDSRVSERRHAWWLERANGAEAYFADLAAEFPVVDRPDWPGAGGAVPAAARPDALLKASAARVRRWFGAQLLRHVAELATRVEQDAAQGLHTPPPPPPPLQPPAAANPFANPFAAAAPRPAEDPAAAAARQLAAERHQRALYRRAQLREFVSLPRFCPDAERDRARAEAYALKRLRQLAEGGAVAAYVWDGGCEADYEDRPAGGGTAADDIPRGALPPVAAPVAAAVVSGVASVREGGRAVRGLPQHDPRGRVAYRRALPTDAELLMHVLCTFLDQRLQAPPAPPIPTRPSAPAAPAPAPLLGIGQPQAAAVAAAQAQAQAQSAASSVAAASRPAESRWFTREHFLAAPAPATGSPARRAPARRPAGTHTAADLHGRRLRELPLIEEVLGDALPAEVPPAKRACPQYVVHVPSTPALAAAAAAATARRVEVRPGPENLWQAVAVLAAAAKLRGRGRVGPLDFGQSALNLLSTVPFDA